MVFRWTIDDKQSLTFHNVVFNVIYQSAAIFKLSVGRRGLGAWGAGEGMGRCPVLTFAFCSALLPRTPRRPWVSVGWGSVHAAWQPAGSPLTAICLHS